MTKKEERTVFFATFLVLFAFVAHWIGGCSANADYREPSTGNTETHWSIISEDNTKEAWKILREEYSEVATAAILGNLHWESKMCPYRLGGLTVEESEKNIGFYTVSRNKFIYMNYAFGLAGWTGTTNLSRLWDWCEENGYDVASIEGQIRFLIDDYPFMAENSHKRMSLYKISDIVTATEDFRQSYEKATSEKSSQYNRAVLAKHIYSSYCEDIYTIEMVANAQMNFDIYMKVKELNERIK